MTTKANKITDQHAQNKQIQDKISYVATECYKAMLNPSKDVHINFNIAPSGECINLHVSDKKHNRIACVERYCLRYFIERDEIEKYYQEANETLDAMIEMIKKYTNQ